MSRRNRKKRAWWFERGADAVARLWPELPRCYRCPLCGRRFFRAALDEDLLTIEHAPPEALGGTGIALTCRDCNSTSGHKLDAEMLAAENVPNFIQGRMQR